MADKHTAPLLKSENASGEFDPALLVVTPVAGL